MLCWRVVGLCAALNGRVATWKGFLNAGVALALAAYIGWMWRRVHTSRAYDRNGLDPQKIKYDFCA
jgi:hypothetical protein